MGWAGRDLGRLWAGFPVGFASHRLGETGSAGHGSCWLWGSAGHRLGCIWAGLVMGCYGHFLSSAGHDLEWPWSGHWLVYPCAGMTMYWPAMS
jgi:hypothetical protein